VPFIFGTYNMSDRKFANGQTMIRQKDAGRTGWVCPDISKNFAFFLDFEFANAFDERLLARKSGNIRGFHGFY